VDVTPEKGLAWYTKLREKKDDAGNTLSVDSHRNILAAEKSFLRWCAEEKRRLHRNPLDGVKGVGKRRQRKEQLRIDEARKWAGKALELADEGEEGAVAALLALMMGMRASEIVSRVVRDLDDNGRLLVIPDAKTPAGVRTLEVPALLRPYLLEQAEGRKPEELLFGYHYRDWVREWVRRICTAAKVPVVTAHGMRGLHSTIAVERGVTGHVVAGALGHESDTTTFQSYVDPEAAARARQRKLVDTITPGAN
jgi:integrase